MTGATPAAVPDLMTPGEAAAALRVGKTTLARWAREDLIDSVELPGGHRRYRRSVIDAIRGGCKRTAPGRCCHTAGGLDPETL